MVDNANECEEDIKSAVAVFLENILQNVCANVDKESDDIPSSVVDLVEDAAPTVPVNTKEGEEDPHVTISGIIEDVLEKVCANVDKAVDALSCNGSNLVPVKSKPDAPARKGQQKPKNVNKGVAKAKRPDRTFQAVFQNQVTGQWLDLTERNTLSEASSKPSRKTFAG